MIKQIKHSTGRGTRVRHSTAMEWDEWERRKGTRGRPRPRYSTGRDAWITHATGTRFDRGPGEGEEESPAGHKSIPPRRPKDEADEYLDLVHAAMRNGRGR